MDQDKVIQALKERRKSQKITLTDLSKHLGIHRNSLGRIEAGETEGVRYEILEKYALHIGLDLTLIHKL